MCPRAVRSPGDVDVEGTRRLLQEAKSAGVEHFLLISIVGVQESTIPYLRRKAQAENLVRSSPLPWTILAATPFYWLVERLHDHMAKKHHTGKKRLWPVASNLAMQPGDSAEFAHYVVEGPQTCPRGVSAPRPGRSGSSGVREGRAPARIITWSGLSGRCSRLSQQRGLQLLEPAQKAVDERRRFIRRKRLSQRHGFADSNAVRDVVVIEQFPGADPQNDPVH